MKIAFVINDIQTELPIYTTIYLALHMHNAGHEVFILTVGGMAYYPDGSMGGLAFVPQKKKYKQTTTFLSDLQDPHAKREKITSKDLDILMLRNNPTDDEAEQSWAKSAGFVFGQLALEDRVIVLNDPNSLSHAINKMYFQYFPEEIRPRTLITRNIDEIREFFKEMDENIILKPLQGSGGKSVFQVRKDDYKNLNQMIDAISRDGYVIAQEYLPEAAKGDVRLIMMNGKPLQYQGKYALFRRVASDHDIRSNIHAGGSAAREEITDEMLHLASVVSPKLIEDGMFLVGLDIVGNKLMEINVFSPGGIQVASNFEGVDFSIPLIESLERKIHYRNLYQNKFNNIRLATME